MQQRSGRVPKADAAQQARETPYTLPPGRAPWNYPLPPPPPPLPTPPAAEASTVRQADGLLFPGVSILPHEVHRFYWEYNALPISWHLAEEENVWYVYCLCLTPRVITPEAVAQLTPPPKAAKATSPELPPAQAASHFM